MNFIMAQRINISANYVTCRVWPLHKGYQKGVQTNATRRDIINIHNPLHQFTIFACGGAPSKTTHFSPWPPPSNVTSQRPVRVGVSVESEEKDGCGTKGEVDKSQNRCLRIARLRRRTKRKTALARVSFFLLVIYWSNRTVWPRHLSFPAPLASSTDGVKSNLTRCELSVRLTVKLLTDETRIITTSERKICIHPINHDHFGSEKIRHVLCYPS